MSDKPSADLLPVGREADIGQLLTTLESALGNGDQTPSDSELVRVLEKSRGRASTHLAATVLIDETIGFLTDGDAQAAPAVRRRSMELCAGLLKDQVDPEHCFWQINDLRCIQQKSLISEQLFCVPAPHSATVGDGLVSVLPVRLVNPADGTFEDTFEQLLQNVLTGQRGDQSLQALASLCRQSIGADTHEYSAIFWLTCAGYIGNLSSEDLLESPAHRTVLRQIEVIIQQHIRDADSPVLDTQGIELVEKSLCNMLFYLACVQSADPLFDRLEAHFRMQHSLQALARRRRPDDDSLLGAGIRELLRKIARLKLDIDAAPSAPQQQYHELIGALTDVRDACSLLLDQQSVAPLHSAKAGLQSYQHGDGALNDLEHCVAVLINIEDVIAKHYLNTHEAVDQSGAQSDEGNLDACINAEMIVMLEPLDAEVGPVDRDWLVVALADIASLSAFQNDDFLARQLKLIKSPLSSDDTETELLTQLALSVKAYLLSLTDSDATDPAKERVQWCTRRLREAHIHIEPPVNLAELASHHRELLSSEVPESVAPVSAASGKVANETTTSKPIASRSLSRLELGEQCNGYIDTIQLALDTALGSSGNLVPDKTVTGALENLHQVVKSTEHDALLELIEPLSQVLDSAEQAGNSLSQSDTLLIQEAIVAITIGVDAVANEQPMPALVGDVAQRITELAVDESHQARGGFEAAGLIDVFVEEGEDIAQRLFELFQRWKSAPQGATKLQSDIKRLLHTLKGSADTVQLTHIAQMAHGLETYLACNDSADTARSDFFQVSTEAVEVILDDIDRVRNREPALNRSDTMERLGGAWLIDAEMAGSQGVGVESVPVDALVSGSDVKGRGLVDHRIESIDKTPAFGSTKYFDRLEKTQRRLTGQFWKSRELQSSLQARLSEMQSSLQSTVYLLGKSDQSTDSALSPVVRESLNDLQHLQAQFQRTLEQLEAVEDQQRVDVMELQSMVTTTDLISVEHLELRTETLIQHLSELHQKPLRLAFTGAALELDRKQFSDLFSPVEQLITNAVVHGIEDSAVRKNSNKSKVATLQVTVKKDDSAVVISVSDDGAGIDFSQLRALAKRRAGYDSNCTDAGLLPLIVEQGVSTSHKIDRSAGRGVGLDVVKAWVVNRRGELSVATAAQGGTTFTLTIPATHETVSVMVVRHGETFFAVDVDKIVEIKAREALGFSFDTLTGSDSPVSNATLCCRTDHGIFELNVDAIVGRQTVKFTVDNRFLNAEGYYLGCGVIDNNQIVLRVDLNRLSGLRHSVGAAPALDDMNRENHANTRKASVLIVDDSVTIRASFGRAMQAAGYEIVLARNGLEAMEYLESHEPEVIILDLEMPLMDGYELGAYIRKQPRLERSALIIVSSKPRSVVGDWLSAVKADAYYEKPCSEETIASLVAELV